MKGKYIIYETSVDPLENSRERALFKEPIGYVDTLEQAEAFCKKGRTLTSKDCWVIGMNHMVPQYTFTFTAKLAVELDEETKQIQLLRKIVSVFKSKTNLRDRYFFRSGGKMDLEVLASLAGNHLFDDQPELFGVTKLEGHCIREFFQVRTEDQIQKEFLKYGITL